MLTPSRSRAPSPASPAASSASARRLTPPASTPQASTLPRTSSSGWAALTRAVGGGSHSGSSLVFWQAFQAKHAFLTSSQEKAAKWRMQDRQMDGLTTNGVLVMHPCHGFSQDSKPGLWREISVCGNVFTLRETRSSQQRGKMVGDPLSWNWNCSLVECLLPFYCLPSPCGVQWIQSFSPTCFVFKLTEFYSSYRFAVFEYFQAFIVHIYVYVVAVLFVTFVGA